MPPPGFEPGFPAHGPRSSTAHGHGLERPAYLAGLYYGGVSKMGKLL